MKKLNFTYSILLFIVGLISTSLNDVCAQGFNENNYSSKKLIIGKKYDPKIPDSAIAAIEKKMEELKGRIEKSVLISDTLLFKINYIVDINNLKSIQIEPVSKDSDYDPNIKALIDLLKKYTYIDVMVTATISNQEGADMIANKVAMILYNGGIEKDRLRVNGLFSDKKKGIVLHYNIKLVPSKEMIDKAIKGTL